jgi:hypothetical protein
MLPMQLQGIAGRVRLRRTQPAAHPFQKASTPLVVSYYLYTLTLG